MKLFTYSKDKFLKLKDRKRFVNLISRIITGNCEFEPYCPNEHDTFFWTVDDGNDWKVEFYQEDLSAFSIIYRYQHETNKAEEALANWLMFRLNVSSKQK